MFYRIQHSGFQHVDGGISAPNTFHVKGEDQAMLHVAQLTTAGAEDAQMTEISETEYRAIARAALARLRG